MTECPRCHGANMMKTIFGSFKCPQCLYSGTGLKRKGKRNVFGMQKTRRSDETSSKKPRKRSSKEREQKTDSVPPQYLQKDSMELIEIVTLRKTARMARLTAIQALGEKADPRALDLLTSFLDHPDMDFRRYAREAIESIRSHQEKQNFIQPP
jgi:FOG: HEAT repeat